MKAKIYSSLLLAILFLIGILPTRAQIAIETGPEITPENMVENILGPGVPAFSNVTFQGAIIARGIFSNGATTNLGIDEGIFLTSGSAFNIPGPNTSGSIGLSTGNPGNAILEGIASGVTYDAAVLEFDFMPQNDTVKCNFVFGSDEYHEWVNTTFNDVFAFMITGPNPSGGNYMNENIALVPGTNTPISINTINNGPSGSGPCMNCEYFINNVGGLTIEYDGLTTVLTLWAIVVPDENYHFFIGITDVGDGIYDSGVLIEGTSFKSLGPPEFLAFNFLKEHNPQLPFDIIGEISDNEVYLEVPEGTNIANLVANFEVRGVDVFVDDSLQVPGVSANNFTDDVFYHLEGYANSDWLIHVDIVTGVDDIFNKVYMGPNPAKGKISLQNVPDIDISIYNSTGTILFEKTNNPKYEIILNDVPKGIYFVEMVRNNEKTVRKLIVY